MGIFDEHDLFICVQSVGLKIEIRNLYSEYYTEAHALRGMTNEYLMMVTLKRHGDMP
jgi:hypothetical protein